MPRTACSPAQILQVTVRLHDALGYEVEAAAGTVAPDSNVVLDFSDPDLPLVRARVTSVTGDRLRLEVVEARSRDLREFPRMSAGINIRYLRVPQARSDELSKLWLAGSDVPADAGTWREPDPLMEFSASGLAFEDTAACEVGEHVLLELQSPDGDGSWRGLGRVVRADRQGDGEPLWSIALALTGLPADAVQSLLEFTVQLQERQSGEAGA